MSKDPSGPTQTQMQQMAEAVVRSLPMKFREQMGEIVMRVEDFATVEQLGGTVAFLCSDDAAQITGTTISVDGGWTAL